MYDPDVKTNNQSLRIDLTASHHWTMMIDNNTGDKKEEIAALLFKYNGSIKVIVKKHGDYKLLMRVKLHFCSVDD